MSRMPALVSMADVHGERLTGRLERDGFGCELVEAPADDVRGPRPTGRRPSRYRVHRRASFPRRHANSGPSPYARARCHPPRTSVPCAAEGRFELLWLGSRSQQASMSTHRDGETTSDDRCPARSAAACASTPKSTRAKAVDDLPVRDTVVDEEVAIRLLPARRG